MNTQLQNELYTEFSRMSVPEYHGVIICDKEDAKEVTAQIKQRFPDWTYDESYYTFKNTKHRGSLRILTLDPAFNGYGVREGTYYWAEVMFCGTELTTVILARGYHHLNSTWRQSNNTLPYLASRMRSRCRHETRLVIL